MAYSPTPRTVLTAAIALIVLRSVGEVLLEWVNQRHVRRAAGEVPAAFRATVDAATYARSINYTLARSRFRVGRAIVDAAVLGLLLISFLLPWAWSAWVGRFGTGYWVAAGFLVVLGVALAVTGLPFAWFSQFRLEARFGFNTTTVGLWLLDQAKGLLLALALGMPLLALVLWIVDRAGPAWWLWAWAAVLAFQLVLAVLAPVLILPLFNKFTPLPEGSLRDRLLALAQRTRFPVQGIQIMDGSRRSRHSNAFFTGFGRWRRIVIFDTLVAQLTECELEAVLAHEIGHFRHRHVVKMLAASAVGMLAGFFVVAWLMAQGWFYRGFGFTAGEPAAVAFALFALLSGELTFWLSPLANRWSRKFEYEADAFAADAMSDPAPLVGALRKLSKENLSNLTPHPLYSAFHYSHPTLLERERALAAWRAG